MSTKKPESRIEKVAQGLEGKPASGREKVRIRWAQGGPFVEGEFDPATSLVHCKRNKKAVRISVHSGLIHWIE